MTIIRDRCPRCNWMNIRRADDASPFTCHNANCNSDFDRLHPAGPTVDQLIEGNVRRLAQVITDPARRAPGVVYYIRWADRIKIGTSTNLKSRLGSLYYDELLAVEPGNSTLERRRHEQFAAHLVDGQREWFHAHDELAAHVSAIRAEHGDPEQYLQEAA